MITIMRMILFYKTCPYNAKLGIMIFVYITDVTLAVAKAYLPPRFQLSNKDQHTTVV